MLDTEREFETKRTRDLLAQNPNVNMGAQIDFNTFQNLLDRMVR